MPHRIVKLEWQGDSNTAQRNNKHIRKEFYGCAQNGNRMCQHIISNFITTRRIRSTAYTTAAEASQLQRHIRQCNLSASNNYQNVLKGMRGMYLLMDTSRKQLESDSINNESIIHSYVLLKFQNMYTAIPSTGGISKVMLVISGGQGAKPLHF